MSQYTTGEIAKLCGVSVRTVQYYDTRGILVPSALSEGGRRLYSDDDMRRMKLICCLRDLGLSIGSIGELLNERDPAPVVTLLLEQQAAALRAEMNETRRKLDRLEVLSREIRHASAPFSFEKLGDMAAQMDNRSRLRRVHRNMIIAGVAMDAIEIGTLLLGLLRGVWSPFIAGMAAVAALGVWISTYYFRRTDYICPQCSTVFHPRLRDALFARHTPRTRKLTCPQCGHRGYCVEAFREPERKARA